MQIARNVFSKKSCGTKAGPGELRAVRDFLCRNIWLPNWLYESIPYFYLASGFSALWAVIYIADWYWFLPIYVLFAIACIHLGYWMFSLRHRNRKRKVRHEIPGYCEQS